MTVLSLFPERHDSVSISLPVMHKSSQPSIGVISQGEGHRDQSEQVDANYPEVFDLPRDQAENTQSNLLSARGNFPRLT